LCGILASHWEATQVVLTDGDTDALAGLRTNVAQNASAYRCPSVRTAQLVWGEGLDDFAQTYGPVFDSILGADIIYVEEILQPLWATVDRLLSAEGVFLLAYARRNVSMDLVLAQATAQNFIWETPADAEGVYLFRRRQSETES
jgi:predicted nicotinamide N-methyase